MKGGISLQKIFSVLLGFLNIQSKDQANSYSNILYTVLNLWSKKQFLTYVGIPHLSPIYIHEDPGKT